MAYANVGCTPLNAAGSGKKFVSREFFEAFSWLLTVKKKKGYDTNFFPLPAAINHVLDETVREERLWNNPIGYSGQLYAKTLFFTKKTGFSGLAKMALPDYRGLGLYFPVAFI